MTSNLFEMTKVVESDLKNADQEIEEKIVGVLAEKEKDLPENPNPKTTLELSTKQKKAGNKIWKTLKKNGVCYLEGHMGSGKTATVAEVFRLLKEKGKVSKMVVFTPVSLIKNEWRNELKKWKIEGSVGEFGEGCDITITTMQAVMSVCRGPTIGHRYCFQPQQDHEHFLKFLNDRPWQEEMGVKITKIDWCSGDRSKEGAYSVSRYCGLYVAAYGVNSKEKVLRAAFCIYSHKYASDFETFKESRPKNQNLTRLYDAQEGKRNLEEIVKRDFSKSMAVVDESHFLRNGISFFEDVDNGTIFDAMCQLFQILRTSDSVKYSIAMSATHIVKRDFDLLSPFVLFDHKNNTDIESWRETKGDKSGEEDQFEGRHVKLKAPKCTPMKIEKIEYSYTKKEKEVFDVWWRKHLMLTNALRDANDNYRSCPLPLRAHYKKKREHAQNERVSHIEKGRRGTVHPSFYRATKTAEKCNPFLNRLNYVEDPHNEFFIGEKASSFDALLTTINNIRRKKSCAPIVIMGQYAIPLQNVHFFLKQNCVDGLCSRLLRGGAKNDDLINDFNSGKVTVLVCTRLAVGTGVNLTGHVQNSCQDIIFLDTDPNEPTEKQHRGRIQRPYAQPNIDRWTTHYILPENNYDVNKLLGYRKWAFEEGESSSSSSSSRRKKEKKERKKKRKRNNNILSLEELRKKRLKALEKAKVIGYRGAMG